MIDDKDEDAHNPFGDTPKPTPPSKPKKTGGVFDDPYNTEDDDSEWSNDDGTSSKDI